MIEGRDDVMFLLDCDLELIHLCRSVSTYFEYKPSHNYLSLFMLFCQFWFWEFSENFDLKQTLHATRSTVVEKKQLSTNLAVINRNKQYSGCI